MAQLDFERWVAAGKKLAHQPIIIIGVSIAGVVGLLLMISNARGIWDLFRDYGPSLYSIGSSPALGWLLLLAVIALMMRGIHLTIKTEDKRAEVEAQRMEVETAARADAIKQARAEFDASLEITKTAINDSLGTARRAADESFGHLERGLVDARRMNRWLAAMIIHSERAMHYQTAEYHIRGAMVRFGTAVDKLANGPPISSHGARHDMDAPTVDLQNAIFGASELLGQPSPQYEGPGMKIDFNMPDPSFVPAQNEYYFGACRAYLERAKGIAEQLSNRRGQEDEKRVQALNSVRRMITSYDQQNG